MTTTSTPEFKLYCFAQSGNAYKAALMLQLCGAKWEPRFVDFFNGETRTPQYRADINEMGEVPVLEHRGKRLSQSGVILHYLAAHFRKFISSDETEKQEILRWILWDNHKLTSYIATLRWMVTLAKVGEPQVHEFLRGRVKSALTILNSHLEKSAFAVGNQPTIADFSLCGYLYWPEEFGVSWSEYPRIGAWLDRIRALPGWVYPYDLMPGHPLKR
ncbi:MAG TPA: glutathione S-transferase [Burkholderiales bacterium]|nr:glutathione S-transferase [Burkholderiales bacterium]